MARISAIARVLEWRGDWYLFYIDHETGRRKRLRCASLGATTVEQRRRLVDQFRQHELVTRADSILRGGVVAFDRPLAV